MTHTVTIKQCYCCKLFFAEDHFYPKTKKSKKLSSYCKPCNRQRFRNWYQKNKGVDHIVKRRRPSLGKGFPAHILLDDEDREKLKCYTWRCDKRGYCIRREVLPCGRVKTLALAREILGLGFGDKRIGDHINGDVADCRRANLRIVDALANAQNVRLRRDNKSGYIGVSWCDGANQWRATGVINRKY
jgi:hypothetical protein